MNVPADHRTLLSKIRTSNPVEISTDKEKDTQFVWYGIKNCLQRICELANATDPGFTLPPVIELNVNIDGLPIFSSTHHLVPVLISTNIKPNLVGIVSVFHYRIRTGVAKKIKAKLILGRFIDDLNEIATTGFLSTKVKLNLITSDLVELAELKGVVGHGGYHACPRCTVVGRTVFSRRCYIPETDGVELTETSRKEIDMIARGKVVRKGKKNKRERNSGVIVPRTDQTFRARTDKLHHSGFCEFENISPPIDVIHDFVIDPMHCLCVNILPRLFAFLRGSHKGYKRTLQEVDFLEIGNRYAKQQFPAEFHRSPRSFVEYKHFKASEKRALILYGLEFYAQKLASGEVCKLLLYLTAAYRIISDPELARRPQLCDIAQNLFELFVTECVREFGDHFVSLNVHLLCHITDDARRRGSVERHSCFKFENALKTIKGKCDKGFRNTMVTMTNRLAEDFVLESNASKREFFLHPSFSTRGAVTTCKYRANIYSTAPPNCYVGTDAEIYKIREIVRTQTDEIILMCQLFRKENAWKIFNASPSIKLDSKDIGIMKVSLLPQVDHAVFLHEVTRKYVFITYGVSHNFVYPLIALE